MGWKFTLVLGPLLLFHPLHEAWGKNAATTASSSWVFRKWMTGPCGRYWNSEMTLQCLSKLPEAGAVSEPLCGRGTVRHEGWKWRDETWGPGEDSPTYLGVTTLFRRKARTFRLRSL